jgi:hypothetical protein
MELLEICNPSETPVQGMGFVDDVNLLAYGCTAEANCANLRRVHDQCLQWAKRHGAKFAPEKYQLIHLSRRQRRFNMMAGIDLGDVTVEPVDSTRILGVFLDTKLRWKEHLAKTQEKMTTRINALTRLTGSTWGFPLIQARQVYNTIIRPAMTYGALAWHQPTTDSRRLTGGITPKLEIIQNKCLRVITGAFRATPIRSLETLTFTAPLDLYLSARIAVYRKKTKETGIEQLIIGACNKARQHLAQDRSTSPVTMATAGHPNPLPASWLDSWVQAESNSRPGDQRQSTQKLMLKKWTERWERLRRSHSEVIEQPPQKAALNLHQGLHKAESSIFVQLRTGKIGLADFLHKAKVPGYDTPQCPCGQARETPAHVTIFCSRFQGLRQDLLMKGRLDFGSLLSTKEGVRRISRWWLRRDILGQFRVANQLISDDRA